MPGSSYIVKWTEQVELLSLATPVVAYAGVSIGRSWVDFAKLGWKTVIIGIVITIPMITVFQPNFAKSTQDLPIETPAYATTGVASDSNSTCSVHFTIYEEPGMPGIVSIKPIMPM